MSPPASAGPTRSPSALLATACAALALVLSHTSGCEFNPPLAEHQLDIPALKAIHAVYSRAVQEARESDSATWQSGWTGNFVVNLSAGESQRGLCWQWRDLVFDRVAPTARSVGWDARGLIVNWGTWLEHNVVIVYDPALVSPWKLWQLPRPRPVWVLDAWVEGRPDIFQLDEWLGNNPDFLDAATIVDLPSLRVISQRQSGQ